MFANIPEPVLKRMSFLEEADNKGRSEDIESLKMYQIVRDAGRFLYLLASLAPTGNYIEIGTSGGYSGLWLSLACKEKGTKFTTFEIEEWRYKLAKETFTEAGVLEYVNQVKGDANELIKEFDELSFCFLDGADYDKCYELVVPKLVKGGILVADNMIVPHDVHTKFAEKAVKDSRVDAVVVPIGTGMLFCKKL